MNACCSFIFWIKKSRLGKFKMTYKYIFSLYRLAEWNKRSRNFKKIMSLLILYVPFFKYICMYPGLGLSISTSIGLIKGLVNLWEMMLSLLLMLDPSLYSIWLKISTLSRMRKIVNLLLLPNLYFSQKLNSIFKIVVLPLHVMMRKWY